MEGGAGLWRAVAALMLGGLTAASASAQGANAGQRLFLRCQTCHAVAAGAPAKVGPNLHGLFGRKAGTLAGYTYSPRMSASGIVWNAATLDQWLTKPSALVPGTTMAFVGLPNPADRAALITWLKTATQ